MRNLLISAAAAALTATAFPAAAQQARDPQAPQQRVADDDGDRVVCVRMQLSGSRVTRRVCRTEREWAERGSLDDGDPRF